jgi:hypothetical protein
MFVVNTSGRELLGQCTIRLQEEIICASGREWFEAIEVGVPWFVPAQKKLAVRCLDWMNGGPTWRGRWGA